VLKDLICPKIVMHATARVRPLAGIVHCIEARIAYLRGLRHIAAGTPAVGKKFGTLELRGKGIRIDDDYAHLTLLKLKPGAKCEE
jgi:hypothetical protein